LLTIMQTPVVWEKLQPCWSTSESTKSVFLNRRAAARYRPVASIIPGREYLCRFSFLSIFHE
jgi:hypothetical protein